MNKVVYKMWVYSLIVFAQVVYGAVNYQRVPQVTLDDVLLVVGRQVKENAPENE